MIVDSEPNADKDENLFNNRMMIFPDSIIKTNLPSTGRESRHENKIITNSAIEASNFVCEMFRGEFLFKFNLKVEDESNKNCIKTITSSQILWLYNYLADSEEKNVHILPPKPYLVCYDFMVSKILEFDQKAMKYKPSHVSAKNLRDFVNSKLIYLNVKIFEEFISSLMEKESLRENFIVNEFITKNSIKFSEGFTDSIKKSLKKISENFPAFQKSCPKTMASRLQMEKIINILLEFISIHFEVHMKEIVILNEICGNLTKNISEDEMKFFRKLKLAKMNLLMIEDSVKSKIFEFLFISISRVTGALNSLEVFHRIHLNQQFDAHNQKNQIKLVENLNAENSQNQIDTGASIGNRLSSLQMSSEADKKILQYSLHLVNSLCKFTILEVTVLKNELLNLIQQTE